MQTITKEMYLGLDASHLGSINGFQGTNKALEALSALIKAAAADGLSLAIASSYRSFERQLLIFNDKFTGKRQVLDAHEKPLDLSTFTISAKCEAILRFSAIPGMSRHHFGTDFDIYSPSLLPKGQKLQLTAWEYDKGQYFYPLGQWLLENLEKYGFYRPFDGSGHIAYEPWHISYKQEAELFIKAYEVKELIAYLRTLNFAWVPYIEEKLNSLGKSLLGI
jgi:LAS superfamily LD-carboxypeptidase LdcB